MKAVHPFRLALLLAMLAGAVTVEATEAFIEAENFKSSGGWRVVDGPAARLASGLAMLDGSGGAADGVATTTVSIKDAGHYRIWVRYSSEPSYRGPFHLTAWSGERELGDGLFDAADEGGTVSAPMIWRFFETDLPEGEVKLRLEKHEHKNCSGRARQIDCVLLTMDDKLVPNHLNYGAQTYVRVTLGEGYAKPAYIHIFADHFHAPWYQHYALGRSGAVAAIAPAKADLLQAGESTPWCNLTPLIYQDSGAMLYMTARYAYTEYAERLRATLEFASAPDEQHVVRRFTLDNQPGTFSIFMPPDLLTPENLEHFKSDREIAEATGALADAHEWPTHGKRPEKFPFFVTATVDNPSWPPDEEVRAREQKTLDYFGFTPERNRRLGGAWLMKDKSYCHPDLEKMKESFAAHAAEFARNGGQVKDVAFCELMDEPTGQTLEFAVQDPSYAAQFRAWLKKLGKTPADLLVRDWDAVKMVTTEQRDEFPALYYFSQRFRTQALGDFMATQRHLAEQAYGGTFSVLANFSDGAVYAGNFYMQGVDYFELLDSPEQNAIWGEDWSNLASTYQCASFNVDLMRAAARERGQIIGQHLIAHAGRKAWDIKLKATSEVARGVKILNSYAYGPTWATHEGGPYWRSHVWQGNPETWTANAALTREIGGVEDLLLTAMPAPAKVALLYSSSSDAWTIGGNLAYGFDRMHTWLALTHAQVPVDIVSEAQMERGALDNYRVCYLSGPNLTQAAANKLRQWVQDGGTLWLSAGAASRDEYNRPLHTFDDLVPAVRGEAADRQRFASSGKFLRTLTPQDAVTWGKATAEVLSVKQALTPRDGATVLARFKDGSAAVVRGAAGQGRVYAAGFLPALAYVKHALDARFSLDEKDKTDAESLSPEEATMVARSANPWDYPAALRDCLLAPVHEAGVALPIACSSPLVDAVFMRCDQGILIPLANYTNRPIAALTVKVSVPGNITRAESVTHGRLEFRQSTPDTVEITLPLENNDFVKLYLR